MSNQPTGYAITLAEAQANLAAEQAIFDAGFEADTREGFGDFFPDLNNAADWTRARQRAIAGCQATVQRCIDNGGWCWV